jgi:hypothetical protein
MRSIRRRGVPIVAAIATALVGVGGLIGLGADAASGPVTLSDATLEWAFNGEMNAGAFDGSCNHLSAGRTDGSQAMYAGTDGDVTIVKRAADGTYSTISNWATRCLDANGTKVTTSGAASAARLGLVIRLSGGDGTHDPATGATTVQWSGTFSANMYDELVPQWFSDPRLVIDAAGHATLSATVAGFASSLDDPDVREATPPIPGVVIARFDASAGGVPGFTATPHYSGVTYESVDNPQVRGTATWGAWPNELIAAMDRTGTGAYWYSTGSAADPRKAPSPITVSFGPMAAPSTTTTVPTTSTPTTTPSTTPNTTTTTTTATTTPTTTTAPTAPTAPTTTTTAPAPTTTPTTTTAAPTTTTAPTIPAEPTTPPADSPTESPAPAATVGSETVGADAAAPTATSSGSTSSGSTSSGSTASSAANQATALAAADTANQAAASPSPLQSVEGRSATTDAAAAVRTVDAGLRYSAVTAEYRPNINPASPGSVAITYTVQNIGAVTLAAKGSARVAPSLGSAVSAATSVTAIAPGRSRTVTQVVEGVWPGFGTESVLRLTPYVPASPDVDLQRASIAARTSATVWPWQQFALVALLVGGGVATGTRLLRRHRRSAS